MRPVALFLILIRTTPMEFRFNQITCRVIFKPLKHATSRAAVVPEGEEEEHKVGKERKEVTVKGKLSFCFCSWWRNKRIADAVGAWSNTNETISGRWTR